jgi:hypothetical protein
MAKLHCCHRERANPDKAQLTRLSANFGLNKLPKVAKLPPTFSGIHAGIRPAMSTTQLPSIAIVVKCVIVLLQYLFPGGLAPFSLAEGQIDPNGTFESRMSPLQTAPGSLRRRPALMPAMHQSQRGLRKVSRRGFHHLPV